MTATADTEKLYVRNPELIATDMDGDTVMMNIEHGEYYGISGVGSRVWELLEKPVTIEEIVTIICREFDVSQVTCKADMGQFINELEALGLLSQP